jgi:signal transduction histidine kinase
MFLNLKTMENEKTFFALPMRSSSEEIQSDFDFIGSQKFFSEIFGNIIGIGAVINENRQIVYVNNDFLTILGVPSLELVLGKRPGEVVSCIHSIEEPNGCGTSMACSFCGAVNAILESQKTGIRSIKETRISTNVNGRQHSLDLNVSSTPIHLEDRKYYVLMLQDISNEKKRNALERIFFHDILNTAGGLNGMLSILKTKIDPDEAHNLIELSEETSRDLVEEIISQRQIRAAENGEMEVKIERLNSSELLASAIKKVTLSESGQNKKINIVKGPYDQDFDTDRILFQRVLLNLLMNALEATRDGGVVTVGVEDSEKCLIFRVKNEGVMSKEVQLQLFQRSFSTKGKNRGLGTYSIKLLAEGYLNGKVTFVSTVDSGTIFSVELFKVWPGNKN